MFPTFLTKKQIKNKKASQSRLLFNLKYSTGLIMEHIFPHRYHLSHSCWLVGCFGLNVPLRQYFSLYRAVSHRERERKKKEMTDERKMSKQPSPKPTASAVGPCPTVSQISTTPRHWKFTQHHRSTQTTPSHSCSVGRRTMYRKTIWDSTMT